MCVAVCGCETVAVRLLKRIWGVGGEELVIGSTHPSPGMNKSLFINTLYWECLNEMIPVSSSGGGKGTLKSWWFKSLVQLKGPILGILMVDLCLWSLTYTVTHIAFVPLLFCFLIISPIHSHKMSMNYLFFFSLKHFLSRTRTCEHLQEEEKIFGLGAACPTKHTRGATVSFERFCLLCVCLCESVCERERENGGWSGVNVTKGESWTTWEDVQTSAQRDGSSGVSPQPLFLT